MQGLYVTPDACLQLVTPSKYEFKTGTPIRWKVLGLTAHTDDCIEWSCTLECVDGEYRVADVNPSFAKDSVVKVEEDAVEWPDQTRWKKLRLTVSQMYMLTYRRPTLYTPVALYVCALAYRYAVAKVAMALLYVKTRGKPQKLA